MSRPDTSKLILLTALSLRMLLFIAVGPWNDHIAQERILTFDDASNYHQAAILLAQNKMDNSVIDHAVYQYFIALLYSIFGYKPYIIIISQIIMGSLTCIFLYKIGQKIFNEKTALFAGLFLAFEYSSILYSNHLLTETMFAFLFIIHIYLLMKFLMGKNIRILVYSAVFLGLSTHVRSIGLYFLVFLILPFFLYFRSNLRKGILSFLILTSVFLFTLTPCMIRNYVVAGEFVLSPDQGRAKYWFFPNIMNIIEPPYASIRLWTAEEKQMMVEEAEQPGMGIAAVVRKYKKYGVTAVQLNRWQKQLHEGTLSAETQKETEHLQTKIQDRYHGHFNTEIQAQEIPATKRFINAILADTKSNIRGIYHFLRVLNSSGYSEILGYPVHRIDQTQEKGFREMIKISIQEKSKLEWLFIFLGISVLFYLYSTSCFGIYTAIRKKEFIKIVLFVSIILYFILASSGPNATEVVNPRHKVPIIPYLIILSCYGMTELIHRFRKSSTEDVK